MTFYYGIYDRTHPAWISIYYDSMAESARHNMRAYYAAMCRMAKARGHDDRSAAVPFDEDPIPADRMEKTACDAADKHLFALMEGWLRMLPLEEQYRVRAQAGTSKYIDILATRMQSMDWVLGTNIVFVMCAFAVFDAVYGLEDPRLAEAFAKLKSSLKESGMPVVGTSREEVLEIAAYFVNTELQLDETYGCLDRFMEFHKKKTIRTFTPETLAQAIVNLDLV
jgi:hypothetical protein